MKRISLIVLVCLLAAPSATMAAQAAAPAQNAPISTWTAWFKSLRRPTRADALRAQRFVKSKWRCMVREQGCSKAERNSLRALAAAVAGAVGYGVKRYRDQQEREAQQQARVRADQAARAQGLRGKDVMPVRDIEERRQELIRQLLAREITPKDAAEEAISTWDTVLLEELIALGLVRLKDHNVDISGIIGDMVGVVLNDPTVDVDFLGRQARFNILNWASPAPVRQIYDEVLYNHPQLIGKLIERGIQVNSEDVVALLRVQDKVSYYPSQKKHTLDDFNKILEIIKGLSKYDIVFSEGDKQKAINNLRNSLAERHFLKPGVTLESDDYGEVDISGIEKEYLDALEDAFAAKSTTIPKAAR